MPAAKTAHKLSSILEPMPFLKIVIDDRVDTDAQGNFLINVGYLRVSTDRQAELGYGLDIQENEILRYCRSSGMTNLVLFLDDGYTGTKMEDRPALAAITQIIRSFNEGRSKIRLDCLIVARIDRLGRTLLGTLQFIQDYIVAGKDSKNSHINTNKEDINFISVAENYCRIEKNNPQGKFLLMLFASLAEFDRDLIVKKLKDGMIARVEEGKWPGGGNIPYGYRYNSKTGILEVVPEEAETIKELFRLYLEEKLSPQKIAARLGFKGEKIVMNILRRKSLTGCIEYKGKEYPGLHRSIIPLERWQEAQEEIASRSVRRGDSQYLLSGLLQCGECGARMRYQKWNRQGECKLVCYSTQPSTREGKPYLIRDESCPQERFWAADVEDAVVKILLSFTYLGDDTAGKREPRPDPIQILNAELKKLNSKLSRLYELEDEEADDILLQKIQSLRSRKRELERQIREETTAAAISRKVDKARSHFRDLDTQWPGMTPAQKQTVCRELIDRVIIYKDRSIDVKLKLRNYLLKQDL